jgi:hypothetical protein
MIEFFGAFLGQQQQVANTAAAGPAPTTAAAAVAAAPPTPPPTTPPPTTTPTTTLPRITNTLQTPEIKPRTTQTYPPINTTTTLLPFERPALKASLDDKPYEIRRECKDFRLSTMPATCCALPKLTTPDAVTQKCRTICSKANGTHCCKTRCKFDEMAVYKNGSFDMAAVQKAHEASLNGPDRAQWVAVLARSLAECLKDQDTKDTTTPIPTTTTDRLSALIQNAIEQGQGQTVMPPTDPPTTTTEKFTGPTLPPLPVRRDATRYCDIPVYVFRIVACVRARNFINCPRFNETSDECVRVREIMVGCGNELNYNY